RRLPLVNLRGYRDRRAHLDFGSPAGCEDSLHALGLEPPLGYQAIGGQAALQGRRGDSVLIDVVAASDGAEFLDIEVRVLDFQGVEGPLHQFEAASDGIFALKQLQTAAQPGIAMVFSHRQHVRVEEGMSIAKTRDCERKTDQVLIAKRAHDLASDLFSDDEQAQRNELDISEAPYFFLQRHTGVHLRQGLAFTKRNGACGQAFWCSCCLACSHKFSSSAGVAWFGVRPEARNRSSIHWKRRLNLRFVFFSADSGSNER